MQQQHISMTHNKINYLDKLHKNGYRMTRQRRAILDTICQADGHATAGEICYRVNKLCEDIDQSTIYRTLNVFVRLGIVIIGGDVNGERVYELVKEDHHHHLFCKNCGHEIEIEKQLVDYFYQQLQDEYNYEVDMDHLIVFGTCSNCSS